MNRSVSGIGTQTSLTEQQKELQTKIEDYQKQIELLEGKLRGYSTLGTLLRESKAECESLKQKKEQLEEKLAEISLFDERPNSSTSMKGAEDIVIKEPRSKKEKFDVPMEVPMDTKQWVNSTMNWNAVAVVQPTDEQFQHRTELLKHKTISSDVLKNVTSPPRSSFEVPVPTSGLSDSGLQESYPVQESLTHDELTQALGRKGEENHQRTGTGTCPVPSVRDMGQSSDDFVHVPRTDARSHQGSLDLMAFPSLHSSGNHNTDVSISDITNVPSSETSEGQCVSLHFEKLANSLKKEKDTSSLNDQVSKVKEEILILEGKVYKYQELNAIRSAQQSDEKVQLKEALASLSRLKTEHIQLLERIRQLEHERDHLSNSGSYSSQTRVVGGGVTVTKMDDKVTENTMVELERRQTAGNNMSEMEELKARNAKLIDANQKWSSEWEKLKADSERKVARNRQDCERLTADLQARKNQQDQEIREKEQQLNALKQKLREEELAKDDLTDKVSELKSYQEKYKSQIEDLEKTVAETNMEKQAQDAELTVLRAQENRRLTEIKHVHAGATSGPDSSHTVIAVLREQVALFQEDFEKERCDRARAQAEKVELQTEIQTLEKKVKTLEKKIKDLEKQMRSAETNVNQTLHQNQELQRENASLKNKLRTERENRPVPVVNQYFPPTTGYHQHPVSPPGPYQLPVQQYAVRTTPEPTNRAQNPPELLPGAWECHSCTYVNYPMRTVCEICGIVKNSEPEPKRVTHTHQLYPRGDTAQQNNYQPHFGMSERPDDLQTDNGLPINT
ncbi:hypothetical protein ScPMuIL_004613 [Solemya velum]